MFKSFLTRKKVFRALVLVLLVAGIFGVTNRAFAGDLADFIGGAVASLGALLIEYVLGKILLLLVDILIWISGYNDFINSIAVINGWAMVRDVVNMFFIIVLLIVAFGTILGQEEYHYKKLLPKLVVMTLFINFSRTLTGLMIDAAQVVMITFVNGYAAAAGGNFANALGITQIMKLKVEDIGGTPVTQLEIAGAVVLGVIMLIISIMTVTALLAVLALRIVMLWALIVLAPLAWLLGTFEQGKKYYAQWWDEFHNQVVVGPALAFFLWLSLATVGSGQAWQQLKGDRPPIEDTSHVSASITAIGDMSTLVSFAVSIAMLLVGLHVAQQFGGAIVGMVNKGKSAAVKGLKTMAKIGMAPVAIGAKWGLARTDDAQARLQQKLAKSKLGKAILPHAVREKLSEHGVALRTIPTAWKLRGQRVEKERLGESMAVAYDLMNRYMPLRRSKSDFTEIERGAEVQKIQKELEGGGTDMAILLNRLNSEYLDKNGRVIEGKEKWAEAVVLMLTKNHDFNEILKNPTISKNLFNSDKPMEVTSENAKEVILRMFNGTDSKGLGKREHEGMRVLNRVGEVGFANTDQWLYKLSDKNVKTGEYEETPQAEHGELVAAYAAKIIPRQNSTSARGQTIFVETADTTGNRTFTDRIHSEGEAWLKRVLPSMSQHLNYMQPEFKNALAHNLHALFDFAQRPELNPSQKNAVEGLIKNVMGDTKGEKPLASRDEILRFEAGQRDDVSDQLLSTRRGETYQPSLPSIAAPGTVGVLGASIGRSVQTAADALERAGKSVEAHAARTAAAVAMSASGVVTAVMGAKEASEAIKAANDRVKSARSAHQAAQDTLAVLPATASTEKRDKLQSAVDLQTKVLAAVEAVGNKIITHAGIVPSNTKGQAIVGIVDPEIKGYAQQAAAAAATAMAAAVGTAAAETARAANDVATLMARKLS